MSDELEQVLDELLTWASQAHWKRSIDEKSKTLSFIRELGFFRKPDVVSFPITPEGLREAHTWAKQEASASLPKPTIH